MTFYEVGGDPYARINGKDFLVLFHYKEGYNSPVFIMVVGRSPLKKEDLPDKNWIFYRVPKSQVYVMYKKVYMPSAKVSNPRYKIFVGGNTAGSMFLALKYLADYTRAIVEDGILHEMATELIDDKSRMGRYRNRNWRVDKTFGIKRNEGAIEDVKAVVVDMDYVDANSRIISSLIRKYKDHEENLYE